MRPRFALAIAAFHSVQHLVSTSDLSRFFRRVRASLGPRGWLAFDVLPPDPDWIGRPGDRRWGRTVFRHPTTGQRLVYTNTHIYDPRRRALHIKIYYQPVAEDGSPSGPERLVRLCHRQLWPDEIEGLLERHGFRLMARFGGFDGREPLEGMDDEHVYVAAVR